MDTLRLVTFSLVVGTTCFLACRETTGSKDSKGIPLPEVAEIKAQAFKWATARYVLADTYIESHYKPPRSGPRPGREQPQRGRRQLSLLEEFKELQADSDYEKEVRVEAVSSIRGVQLTPLSRNKCAIKFDFVESANPHAKVPASVEAMAERFETPTGHYWVVR